MKTLFALFFALLLTGAAYAVEPAEMLKDPVLEARAREVSKVLRCVVCQNETIDESNADIARDMRILLRARILAGDSNEQVIAFLRDRYGDYVLLKPRFAPITFVLWLGPFLLLGIGALVVYRRLRGTPAPEPVPLSAEDKVALEELSHTGERAP